MHAPYKIPLRKETLNEIAQVLNVEDSDHTYS
jgi:hypothetical protein